MGWAIAEHMRESLVSDALRMAWGRKCPLPGLLQHTDRGVQYASHAYQSFGITYPTLEAAKRDVIDYIEMYYNTRRLHTFLGYCSPADFEKQYEGRFV